MRETTTYATSSSKEESKLEFRMIRIFAEGQVTEIDYFKGVKSYKKELGIKPTIEIEPEKRTKDKAGWSNISKVIEYIELIKKEHTDSGRDFLRENDELWIVFDRDQITLDQFNKCLEYAKKENYNVGFTNSCFEMWLLMHFSDFDKYDRNSLEFTPENKAKIVTEVIEKSDRGLYGKEKKKVKFENFKDGIELAVVQSVNFNGDLQLDELYANLGCTLGQLLETIRND